jgi:hypothetical protein
MSNNSVSAAASKGQQDADLQLDQEGHVEFDLNSAGPTLNRSSGKSIIVFSADQGKRLLRDLNLVGDSDSRGRIKAAIGKAIANNGLRLLILPPAPDSALVTELLEHFPNFRKLIQLVVIPHLALLHAGANARLPPLLLVGPPGVGKSAFAFALAELLAKKDGREVPSMVAIDVAASTNGSGISGLSSHWSNATNGQIFQLLAIGPPGGEPAANGVVILDEVDKAHDGRYPTLGGLYSLLEQSSARRFEDQSLPGLIMDASHLRWLLLANDATHIPQPILSRALTFEIGPPTHAEMLGVVRRIAASLVERLGLDFSSRLPADVEALATDMSPREVRVRLEASIGLAVQAGRKTIEMRDWAQFFLTKSKPRMGFS